MRCIKACIFLLLFCSIKLWPLRPKFSKKYSQGWTPPPLSHFGRTNVKLLPTPLLNLSLATWRQLKQQQRKYDTCTPHSYRYYKQIADRNSCFGGTKLYLGQCNLGGTHKSNSPDSSKQIQSYRYEIFTRRDCTHWIVSYETNKLTNLSTIEISPDMRIYFANSVNWYLNLSLQIGNYQR